MAAGASESCRRHPPELDFINRERGQLGLKLTAHHVFCVFLKDGHPRPTPTGFRALGVEKKGLPGPMQVKSTLERGVQKDVQNRFP